MTTTTTTPIFTIGAEGIDTAKLVEEIRQAVAEKTAAGRYADARIARAERMNLVNLKNEEEFIDFYLAGLQDAIFVDINDFEIVERRARLGSLLVALKKTIWKLLKFYTYRLWSQQNLVNGLLLSALETTEHRHRTRIKDLEARIAGLEKEIRNPKSEIRNKSEFPNE